MLNIIIFGTGSSAEKLLPTIDDNKVRIIAFSDNDKTKHHTTFYQYNIIPPEKIVEQNFDYIIIASQFSDEIMSQLLKLGIDYKSIIPMDYERHNWLMRIEYKNTHKIIKKKTQHPISKKLKFALINYNYSNYHGYALYKYIPQYILDKYEVDLIEKKDYRKLAVYDVICSSHFDGIYDSNKIHIEMWHGFPLKKMGILADEDLVKDEIEGRLINIQKRLQNTQLIFSYSSFYTTLFNSSFPSTYDKYAITGMPRNDLLFENNGMEKLQAITKKDLDKLNVLFYLPTWRKGKNEWVDSTRTWTRLFGFEDESENDIIQMIENNNLFLVVKLHPFEYNMYKDLEVFTHNQVYLLTDDELFKHKIHLYELLSAAKLLITDYSSVFFDTLLIDLPTIFAPTDLSEYEKNRGFLIDPYDVMTPGPTVNTLQELNKEITNVLNGVDRYKDKRELVKNIVFKYKDNKASERVWKEIDNYLTKLISN